LAFETLTINTETLGDDRQLVVDNVLVQGIRSTNAVLTSALARSS
jgi:hypothetical protein